MYVLVFCLNEYSCVYYMVCVLHGRADYWKTVTENGEKVSVLRLLL